MSNGQPFSPDGPAGFAARIAAGDASSARPAALDQPAPEAPYLPLAAEILLVLARGRGSVLLTGDPVPSLLLTCQALRQAGAGRHAVVGVASGPDVVRAQLQHAATPPVIASIAGRGREAPAADDTGAGTAERPPLLFVLDDVDRLGDEQLGEIYEMTLRGKRTVAGAVLLASTKFLGRLQRPALEALRDDIAGQFHLDPAAARQTDPALAGLVRELEAIAAMLGDGDADGAPAQRPSIPLEHAVLREMLDELSYALDLSNRTLDTPLPRSKPAVGDDEEAPASKPAADAAPQRSAETEATSHSAAGMPAPAIAAADPIVAAPEPEPAIPFKQPPAAAATVPPFDEAPVPAPVAAAEPLEEPPYAEPPIVAEEPIVAEDAVTVEPMAASLPSEAASPPTEAFDILPSMPAVEPAAAAPSPVAPDASLPAAERFSPLSLRDPPAALPAIVPAASRLAPFVPSAAAAPPRARPVARRRIGVWLIASVAVVAAGVALGAGASWLQRHPLELPPQLAALLAPKPGPSATTVTVPQRAEPPPSLPQRAEIEVPIVPPAPKPVATSPSPAVVAAITAPAPSPAPVAPPPTAVPAPQPMETPKPTAPAKSVEKAKPVTAPTPSAAPAPTAATPPPAAAAHLPPAEIAELIARGDSFLRAGDIASARLFYERAAESGNGQAALLAGETYDPRLLARAGLRGVQGDKAKAAEWYGRAFALGAPGADAMLKNLDAGR